MPQSCLIFQSTVRTQEIHDIFREKCLLRRPYSDQGVATELSWRSIAFLRCSWWRFSALSRCFHCASTALTAHAPRFHGVATALRTQWHLQERRAVSVQKPRTTTAFAQRPLCAPTELLLRCRRPYCAAMVTLRRPLCALLGRRANAEWQCLFWVCSKCAASLGVLCDPSVSNGDATVLLRWRLRSYCAHLGVLQFLGHYGITVRTPPWCDKGFTVCVYLLLGIFCLHKVHEIHKVIQFSVDCRILFVFL